MRTSFAIIFDSAEGYTKLNVALAALIFIYTVMIVILFLKGLWHFMVFLHANYCSKLPSPHLLAFRCKRGCNRLLDSNKFEITIQERQKEITVTELDPWVTIAELKFKIGLIDNEVDPEKIRLVFDGNEIKDDEATL